MNTKSNLKLKIVCGFRKDQEHTISIEEAHKAYYLFFHPEQRGSFKQGFALVGSSIQEIVPDWQGSMGWNPTHTLDTDDWSEIRASDVEEKMKNALAIAKEIARVATLDNIDKPLNVLAKEYNLLPQEAKNYLEAQPETIMRLKASNY